MVGRLTSTFQPQGSQSPAATLVRVKNIESGHCRLMEGGEAAQLVAQALNTRYAGAPAPTNIAICLLLHPPWPNPDQWQAARAMTCLAPAAHQRGPRGRQQVRAQGIPHTSTSSLQGKGDPACRLGRHLKVGSSILQGDQECLACYRRCVC